MEFRQDVRPSPIAGRWYTDDPELLAQEVDAYIEEAKLKDEDIDGIVIGIVAPHAGYRYSGRTAGYAYRAVQGKPRDLAVVLSPFHHFISGKFVTTAHGAYGTPLGAVGVEIDLLDELEAAMAEAGLELGQAAEDEEHSLEIQLPFLQRAWQSDFRVLPVMIRSRSPQEVQAFADSLYETIKDEDYLLVASTDLSHFFNQSSAEEMDAEMLRRIKDFDPEAVLTAEAEGEASACGAAAIAGMLWTARKAGADRVNILNYSTSANATGDRSSVVGYGAAVVVQSK